MKQSPNKKRKAVSLLISGAGSILLAIIFLFVLAQMKDDAGSSVSKKEKDAIALVGFLTAVTFISAAAEITYAIVLAKQAEKETDNQNFDFNNGMLGDNDFGNMPYGDRPYNNQPFNQPFGSQPYNNAGYNNNPNQRQNGGKFCPRCGGFVANEHASFCDKCGNRF